MMNQGCVSALMGRASDAVQKINSGIAAWRSTGATLWAPFRMSLLAKAYAELGQFDDAWRCITEAMTVMETTKERWCEAEINRIAGEIAINRRSGMRQKQKTISSAPSPSPVSNKRNPGSSAQR